MSHQGVPICHLLKRGCQSKIHGRKMLLSSIIRIQDRAGNYFCPQDTLQLFKCLAGQIPGKKAITQLKICSRGPYVAPLLIQESRSRELASQNVKYGLCLLNVTAKMLVKSSRIERYRKKVAYWVQKNVTLKLNCQPNVTFLGFWSVFEKTKIFISERSSRTLLITACRCIQKKCVTEQLELQKKSSNFNFENENEKLRQEFFGFPWEISSSFFFFLVCFSDIFLCGKDALKQKN